MKNLEARENVRVIYLEKNMGMGFGKKILTENFDTPYLYMMDDDIVVLEGWLPPLIEAMKKYEDLGAVASVPLLYGMRFPIHYICEKLEVKEGVLIRSFFTDKEIQTKMMDGLVLSDTLTSGCCLFRDKIFKHAKFDEELYYGTSGIVGLDFWLQVRKSKWKTAYCQNSIVDHRPWLCSVSEYIQRRNYRIKENLKSREYLLKKHQIKEIVERRNMRLYHPLIYLRTVFDLVRGTILNWFQQW